MYSHYSVYVFTSSTLIMLIMIEQHEHEPDQQWRPHPSLPEQLTNMRTNLVPTQQDEYHRREEMFLN